MTRSCVLLVGLLGTSAAAQQPRPAIPQPATPSSVRPGDSGPAKWQNRSKREPDSRAARSDTSEILEAVARKLSLKASQVQESQLVIQRDTAWVTLTNSPVRAGVYRLERRHTWKVVDQPSNP